ncbi:MAG: bifunctional [glutamate--ammonia ligase]-adenylyl-L-tyrosine phosphorylase/[glutamate--ammonia-ligase] adenylyltransferase [Nitrosomonas sp.]|nr:bifunctional [glutamate--ammonia ligase]-adenylyl-L-tyrosine phosphorylase/[glutamate--ammonia-ligase] adenylyltransferase [Nitrosomonas sp.]
MILHGSHTTTESLLEKILPFSRYVQRLLASEPDLQDYLMDKGASQFLREEMLDFLNSACVASALNEAGLNAALRKLRKRVMLRLAARDLAGLADLPEVMMTMTQLAEVTIQFALKHHQIWMSHPEHYGEPIGEKSASPRQLLVIAMGKLGGGELNVSSDVDLIFLYPEEGETNGKKSISNHEFFTRLGRKLIASLNDYTIDGYVFRVDMRLRPHGENSPLTISFAMLEEYLTTQGREWERHAWLKSRVIVGSLAEEAILMEQIVRPFVFRKYLDFEAYEAMRRLHAQLRKEVDRREMHDNIKLGPGGIREIEFITQVFQLIRGGRDADLCIRSTLATLGRLLEKQPLPSQTIQELIDAYQFLRKLEHRLQYLDDQQTQSIPENTDDQALIAETMGFASSPELFAKLDIYRSQVTRHFELIFAVPRKSPTHDMLTALWQEQPSDLTQVKAATHQLTTLGFSEPEKISARIQQFYVSQFFQKMPLASQQKITAVMPTLVEAVAQFPPIELTLERMLQLLEHISQHPAYLALLLEHPQTLPRVAKLVNSSQWASNYLGRHPILLDELLAPQGLYQLPDWKALKVELMRQLNHINSPKKNITEWQMDVLRHFQHAQVFQLLAVDLEGVLLLETLSDHLTELADLILGNVLNLAWQGLKKKHQEQPLFAIIGYGKLGGKELGYSSDLDIVFLYDDNHPDALEIYTKLSQSINTWLTSHTSAGGLYETDLRLRPEGTSGLLTCSLDAFKHYQQSQAWVWEHQALTRARFVVGNEQMGAAFEAIRKEILCKPRDLAKLKQDILMMREKMLDAHPNPTSLFDIKHDRGGIIDVEFMVQYLVLGYSSRFPQLTGNIGNIALLKLAGNLGLIPSEMAQHVLSIYREYRRIHHRLRLSGDPELTGAASTKEASVSYARIEATQLNDARKVVLQLWEEVFAK